MYINIMYTYDPVSSLTYTGAWILYINIMYT
jgi:hypothetical protein